MYKATHTSARRYGFEERVTGQREYDRIYDRISLDKKRAILMVWDLIHFTSLVEIR
jgi:hypothetical protein